MALQLGRINFSRYAGSAGVTIPVPKDAKPIGVEFSERNSVLAILILQGSGVIEYVHRHFMIWGEGNWVQFPESAKDVVVIGTYVENNQTFTLAEVIA